MAFLDSLKSNQVIAFVLAHLEIFIALALICAAGIMFFLWYSKRYKPQFKPIDRSEIERVKFIQRMKFNKAKPHYFFYHGNSLIGGIILEKKENIATNPNGKEIGLDFIVVKPLVFYNLIPMGRETPFILNAENTREENDRLTLNGIVPIHNFSGIYYDETLEAIKMESKGNIIDFIKNDSLVRTSFEDAMSVFYVKAMEQVTFNPVNAQEIQKQQAEIEKEKEKRKSLVD